MIWTVSSFLLVAIGIAVVIKWKGDFIHESVMVIGVGEYSDWSYRVSRLYCNDNTQSQRGRCRYTCR